VVLSSLNLWRSIEAISSNIILGQCLPIYFIISLVSIFLKYIIHSSLSLLRVSCLHSYTWMCSHTYVHIYYWREYTTVAIRL
jgi:ABC-type transport system involved in Fe-S cluster assembly fused permease/ATPase subunit